MMMMMTACNMKWKQGDMGAKWHGRRQGESISGIAINATYVQAKKSTVHLGGHEGGQSEL